MVHNHVNLRRSDTAIAHPRKVFVIVLSHFGRCHGVLSLLIEKFVGESERNGLLAETAATVTVSTAHGPYGRMVSLRTADGEVTGTIESAREWYDQLETVLTEEYEFVHTAGTHRPDGRYVLERTGADSAGNRKVFDSIEALWALFERVPTTFTADDLGGDGLSGSRRHAVLWHFVEHPAFPCRLESKQPLSAKKCTTSSRPIRSDTEPAEGASPESYRSTHRRQNEDRRSGQGDRCSR